MDLGDIIVVIAAIAGVIISAISKSAKKKAEARSLPTSSDVWDNEAEAEAGTFEPVEKGWAYKYLTVEQPAVEEVQESLSEQLDERWSYDQQAVDELESVPQYDDYTRKKKADDIRIEAYEVGKSEQNASVAGEDFNLRDAIIYSELLKPKFKEY